MSARVCVCIMLSENNLISPPLLLFVREVAENLIYPEFFGGGGGDQGVGRVQL